MDIDIFILLVYHSSGLLQQKIFMFLMLLFYTLCLKYLFFQLSHLSKGDWNSG